MAGALLPSAVVPCVRALSTCFSRRALKVSGSSLCIMWPNPLSITKSAFNAFFNTFALAGSTSWKRVSESERDIERENCGEM